MGKVEGEGGKRTKRKEKKSFNTLSLSQSSPAFLPNIYSTTQTFEEKFVSWWGPGEGGEEEEGEGPY